MSVVRHRINERRIPGRGPLGPLRPLRPLGHLGPPGPALTAVGPGLAAPSGVDLSNDPDLATGTAGAGTTPRSAG